jgi:outer membrane protein assembly factor BamA
VIEEELRRHNRIRLLTGAINYDTRDNFFDPSEGIYTELRSDISGLVLGSTSEFLRTSFGFNVYSPLSASTILASGLEVAWIDAAQGLSGIPLNERLYAGGPNTLRAFQYEKVGPLDAGGNPRGGQLRLVLHPFELRQDVYKIVGVAAFLDIGQVWSRTDRFKLSGLRYSPGAGLRVNTPIGIARLDYGINIDPKPGEAAGQVHVSIGHAF